MTELLAWCHGIVRQLEETDDDARAYMLMLSFADTLNTTPIGEISLDDADMLADMVERAALGRLRRRSN